MNLVIAMLGIVVAFAFMILEFVAVWRVYTKADRPGWAIIIPIYNTLVLLRIVGRPWWWLLLMLVPIVNLVVMIITNIDLARSFGKGVGFGVCLIFFSFVCMPILAFSDATYVGPAGGGPQQWNPGGPQYQGA